MNGKKETDKIAADEDGQGRAFNGSSPLKKMRCYAMLVGVCWTILFFGLLSWDIYSTLRFTKELAIKEARANFNKDQAFRYWAASHGGVYVPIDEYTPPNPYLENIPDRDIRTPEGKELTLMNPAYMVRQMNELFSKEYGIAGHITSLKLHNPNNTPDDWERKALEAFEKGKKEVLEFSSIKGEPYIRLMQPMIVVEGCLKCHAYQGYKVGDVRGGVSVSFPLYGLYGWERKEIVKQTASHGLIWLLGLVGIFVGYGKTRRYLLERIRTEGKLREAEDRATALLNATLESLILIDLDGRVLAINNTGAKRLNETKEHLLGKNIFDFMPPEEVDSRRRVISEILRTRKSVTFEDRKGDREFYTNMVPVHNGGVHAIALFSQDITERKLADMVIRESEEKYRRLVENLRKEYFFYSHGTDGVFTYLSPSIEGVLGYSVKEFLKHYTEYLTDNPMNDEFVRYTELSLKGQQQPPYELEVYHKDGSMHVLEISEIPVFNDDGKVIAVEGIAHDVTSKKETDLALKESEQRLSSFIENFHGIAFLAYMNYVPIFFQGKVKEITGYSESDFKSGKPDWFQIIYKDDTPLLEEDAHKIRTVPGYECVKEYRIVRKDGTLRWVQEFIQNVCDESGKPHMVRGAIYDITEKKMSESALAESEERFRQLAENIEEVFWLTEWEDNRVIYASPAFEAIWGKKRKQLYNDSMEWTKSIHPDDRKGVEDAFINLVAWGGFNIEYRIVQPGGGIRWIHDKGFPVKNDEGKVYRVAGIAHDITERKRVEDKLRQSEERLNRGQEVGHVGTWDWDPNTGKLLWSDETYRIHGFEPGEVEPSYELFLEMVHPDDREALNKAVGLALTEKANYNIDCRIVRKDGIQRITNATGRVIFDADGKPEHMLGTFQDITDRKQMEEALYFIAQKGWEASGEDFFETLVAYLANTLKVDYAFVGKILDNKMVRTVALHANGKIEENIEYELRGTPCENVIGKDFCCYPENIRQLFPDDEMLVPMKAESYIGIPVWDSKGKSMGLIAVVGREVIREVESAKALLQLVAIRAAHEMERRIVDEELRKSEGMLRDAQRITNMGNWELNLATDKLFWSDEVFRIFEVEKGVFEPSYDAFLGLLPPGDRENVDISYRQSVEEHEKYDIIHRLIMQDGRIKYLNEKCRTDYVGDKAVRSIGTVQDISAIKKAEMDLQKAKEEVEKASRAKSEFMSRMSHELRTPLNSILGFAQIIQSDEAKIDEKQKLCVDEITSAGWHLTDLINEVLDIARIETGNLSLKFEPADICPIMNECMNLISPLAEERNIKINTNLKSCNNDKVLGDKTRLKEVFLNLLSNAVKYNIEDGEVTISCDKRDEKSLLISVSDSGKGISVEDQKLLFVPFSRIKGEDPAIQGTGIGLAISKHLIELMGGEIGVESAPGKGSTFWVKLQIAE